MDYERKFKEMLEALAKVRIKSDERTFTITYIGPPHMFQIDEVPKTK